VTDIVDVEKNEAIVQKEKGAQRRKRQEEILKAEKLGVEGPKRKIPRVRQGYSPC